MADLHAHRTLVKSPPELWTELSDPVSLARRLAEFGEIRITRLVPETTVAWEGERASGTVELESSGWGTKVRLTARPTPAAAPIAASERITAVIEGEPAPASDDPAPEPGAISQDAVDSGIPTPTVTATVRRPSAAAARSAERAARRATEAAALAKAATPPEETVPPPPAPTTQAEAPERGRFRAWILRRRRRRETDAGPPLATDVAPTPVAAPPEPMQPDPSPESTQPARYAPAMASPSVPVEPVAPPADVIVAAKPRPARLDPEQTMAVLSGVLDDLGSAHHRPFSRE